MGPNLASDSENLISKLPRVCLLTETFYPVVGGGESHARLLARKLNNMGMPTFVLTRRSSPGLSPDDMVDNIPTYRIPPSGMKRLGKYAMAPVALHELYRRRLDYDIILVCGFRVLGVPAVVAAQKWSKTCILRAEALGEMSGGYASAYQKLPPYADKTFEKWIDFRNRTLRQADCFASVSQPMTEEFKQCGIDENRIIEIPNGVDTDVFQPVDFDAKVALRQKLELPTYARIVSYSGKLNQGKGLQDLIRAWECVSSLHEDAHLVLVGSGDGQSLSCEDELRRLVAELCLDSRVRFTGYVENVNEYLQASDMFVFPSENESFGISLVEAMACGLPAIASRVGGIPDIVQHLRDGILVEPRDHHALAIAITDLLVQPALTKSLGLNASQMVRDRYSIEAVASRYYELLSNLYVRKNSDH